MTPSSDDGGEVVGSVGGVLLAELTLSLAAARREVLDALLDVEAYQAVAQRALSLWHAAEQTIRSQRVTITRQNAFIRSCLQENGRGRR